MFKKWKYVRVLSYGTMVVKLKIYWIYFINHLSTETLTTVWIYYSHVRDADPVIVNDYIHLKFQNLRFKTNIDKVNLYKKKWKKINIFLQLYDGNRRPKHLAIIFWYIVDHSFPNNVFWLPCVLYNTSMTIAVNVPKIVK